jgi:hypothetical protein
MFVSMKAAVSKENNFNQKAKSFELITKNRSLQKRVIITGAPCFDENNFNLMLDPN